MIPIAFGHRKRTGKDTAAKFLVNYLRTNNSKGLNIQHGSFAYELKLSAYQLYGWAGLERPEYYELSCNAGKREEEISVLGKSPRELWIEYGMKVREIYPDTWVDLLFNKNRKCDVLVISDLRFMNEVKKVKLRGGWTIKIERDSIVDTDDEADRALAGFDGFDYVLKNNGDLNELYEEVSNTYLKIAEVA